MLPTKITFKCHTGYSLAYQREYGEGTSFPLSVVILIDLPTSVSFTNYTNIFLVYFVQILKCKTDVLGYSH